MAHILEYESGNKRPRFRKLKSRLVKGLIISSILAGASYFSRVSVDYLGKHDFNRDGIDDAIVALPIPLTNKSLVGYVNFHNIPTKLTSFNGGVSFNTFTWNFRPLSCTLAENLFNPETSRYSVASVEDRNRDGTKEIYTISYCDGKSLEKRIK